MTDLADHLADLTGFRDRDLLDVTLVRAIKDLLHPLRVAIYRRVGEAKEVSEDRWLMRAQLTLDSAVATSDPAWTEHNALPRVNEKPYRLKAMEAKTLVEVSGANDHITVFPVLAEYGFGGVVEIETAQPMAHETQLLVTSILRIYCNFASLLDYSERDTLTGLLNRKTFDGAFVKVSAEQTLTPKDLQHDRRASTEGLATYWLGVIDIDHFKRVNDRYGHLIGDEVLLLLSRLMRVTFRSYDRLYRFGGEEFVVLLRCQSQVDAAGAFERFRCNAEKYHFPQVGQITVSIGFTCLRASDTPSSAFERADKAVYYVKEHGRNRVCSYADLIAQGELVEDSTQTGVVEMF